MAAQNRQDVQPPATHVVFDLVSFLCVLLHLFCGTDIVRKTKFIQQALIGMSNECHLALNLIRATS